MEGDRELESPPVLGAASQDGVVGVASQDGVLVAPGGGDASLDNTGGVMLRAHNAKIVPERELKDAEDGERESGEIGTESEEENGEMDLA